MKQEARGLLLRQLNADVLEYAEWVQRLLATIKYVVGIAERGEGRQQRDDETTEQFVLGYVKRIESSLRNRPTCTNSQTATWRNVASDGPPPCNGEDWFLGANSQGAMCCFNFLDDTGMCWYCGPEDNAQLMDGLIWWAKVDAPDMAPNV